MKHDKDLKWNTYVAMPTIVELASGLIDAGLIEKDVADKILHRMKAGQTRTGRQLWEASGLPSEDFAEAISKALRLPRAPLGALMAASALAAPLATRFLRETACYPCLTSAGAKALAMADPTDADSLHAVEIAVGEPVEIFVSSFDDVAAVQSERLEAARLGEGGVSKPEEPEETLEALRDLAAGAPVVHAVDDLFEKAVEWRASDIHVEPFRAGLSIRLRVDGLLRPLPPPTDAPG